MNSREEKKKRLQELAAKAKAATDELLSEELENLKKITSTDVELLRVKITNKETYDKLIDVVKESTAKNENLAQLKTRIEKLGSIAKDVVKEVINLIK